MASAASPDGTGESAAGAWGRGGPASVPLAAPIAANEPPAASPVAIHTQTIFCTRIRLDSLLRSSAIFSTKVPGGPLRARRPRVSTAAEAGSSPDRECHSNGRSRLEPGSRPEGRGARGGPKGELCEGESHGYRWV